MFDPSGRADTGFKHVKPTEYTPKLLHFRGEKVRPCDCVNVIMCVLVYA